MLLSLGMFLGAVAAITCGVMLGNFGTYVVRETWEYLDDKVRYFFR